MSSTTSFASRSALVLGLSLAALGAPGCSSDAVSAGDQAQEVAAGNAPIAPVLAAIADGTAWNDLPADTKEKLAASAAAYVARVNAAWGKDALDRKASTVIHTPTPEMVANLDRVLGSVFEADVPKGFQVSRDVKSPELLVALKRLYVAYVAELRHMLVAKNADFRDWDGSPVREFIVRDRRTTEEQKAFAHDLVNALRGSPTSTLTEVERAIVRKALFIGRQLEESSIGLSLGGDDLLQTGTAPELLPDFIAQLAKKDAGVFVDDESFFQAFNAYTQQPLAFGNVGTVSAFNWDLDGYVDTEWMTSTGVDPTSAAGKGYLVLAEWWRQRVSNGPGSADRCTLYTPEQRQHIWNAITADNLTNDDASSTLESYAASYGRTATARLGDIKVIARAAVGGVFPEGSSLLNATQRAQVFAAIDAATQPAAVVDTVTAALDAATNATDASAELKKQLDGLTVIGGNYAEGEALRAADQALVLEMWGKVRAYLARRYSGLPVDVAALVPDAPIITTGDGIFATADGNVTVGLATGWKKATFYGTLLHEIKHAIDFRSGANVQGSAWEGAAVAADRMLTTEMTKELMADEASRLPLYELGTAVDRVRLTATTDATLKVLVRTSCSATEPDTMDYARETVKSYGYSAPNTLTARAQRAHLGAQYLSYDLGYTLYTDLLGWLEARVPNASRPIDPILLQACGMPSPNRDDAAVAKLNACLAKSNR